MPLAKIAQSDFAAGSVRATARHLIPDNGVYAAYDVLTDDDGSLYRRGGSEYLSTAGLGSTGLRFLWEGTLGPGLRTVFANPDDFGVLDGSNGVVNLGNAGLSAPTRAVETQGMLFIGGGFVYGGSRKAADYSTGTITATNGSKTVTGAGGTLWNANVDAGMILVIGSERPYVVEAVGGDTSLTLRDAYEGSTGAGKAYSLQRVATLPASLSSSLYAVAANRLFKMSGSRLDFSAPERPTSFAVDDNWLIPGGATILGGERIRDSLLVFTSTGLWVLSGLHFDLTDDFGNVQQRLEQANQDLILWSNEGIATWGDRLVVPCTDGVYLVDHVSGPEKLSRSVAPLYQDYVRKGYRTGLATVYKGHYFLPVLDSSSVVKDLLTCRLDRPTRSRIGVVFPWTFPRGHGGNVTALVARAETSAARSPKLLAASRHSGSRVLDLSRMFEPQAAVKNDADGTTHEFEVQTRDYPTGPFNRNLVERLRGWYELVDAASDNPTIQAYYSDGSKLTAVTEWGLFDWGQASWSDPASAEWAQITESAPEDDGRSPFTWLFKKRTRFIRFKLRSASPAARLVLRGLELYVRPSMKDR